MNRRTLLQAILGIFALKTVNIEETPLIERPIIDNFQYSPSGVVFPLITDTGVRIGPSLRYSLD